MWTIFKVFIEFVTIFHVGPYFPDQEWKLYPLHCKANP